MKLLPVIALIFIVFFPDQASAAGFIPCDGANVNGLKECSACDFAVMGNTILKWLIGVLFMVFAIMAAAAGFGLVTSGGNPQAKTDAKNKLVNAIVGIIIVLAAWLLVDTVMRGLLTTGPAGQTGYISGYGPWSQIQCQNQAVTTAPTGSGFPPPPAGNTYAFQIYELDTANNCLIPRSGSDSQQSVCITAQTAAVTSAAGTTYVIQSCDPAVSTVSQPATPPVCGPSSAQCGVDSPSLMALYNGSPVSTNAPALTTMKNCYESGLAVSNPGILDTTKTYTFELTEPRCANTNGTPVAVCGINSCAHSVGSCHYGRGGGQGAMAVDFNAINGTQAGEQALFNAIQALQGSCGGTLLFEQTSATAWHTHISAPGC